jgi:hypothetical protein
MAHEFTVPAVDMEIISRAAGAIIIWQTRCPSGKKKINVSF